MAAAFWILLIFDVTAGEPGGFQGSNGPRDIQGFTETGVGIDEGGQVRGAGDGARPGAHFVEGRQADVRKAEIRGKSGTGNVRALKSVARDEHRHQWRKRAGKPEQFSGLQRCAKRRALFCRGFAGWHHDERCSADWAGIKSDRRPSGDSPSLRGGDVFVAGVWIRRPKARLGGDRNVPSPFGLARNETLVHSQWMQSMPRWVSARMGSATSGWVRPTCARSLFWNACSWFKAAVQLPRPNEAQAALSDARNGRLFFRSILALLMASMISSTASHGLTISTVRLAVVEH